MFVAKPADVLVVARNISLDIGGRAILEDISLEISQGEIVTLIGPNGAGKSSLAKVLLGLMRPTAGTVTRAAGLRVGYVPQRFPFEAIIPLTVERLVTLTNRVARPEIDRVLGEVGILALKQAQVSTLSGGELQRALLARALLRRPDLLVLDEPVQGVDVGGEARLYQLIGRIRREHGCAVLMVSHDIHVVMAESDRVMCLNRHVCCEGVPETVRNHPEYVRLFGPAADAIGVYTHHHDHRHNAAGEIVPLAGHGDHHH
jgi:zinc transport system ATP-binding protein